MYDLEEQEQIDSLKAWWRQYGRWVMVGTAAALLGVGGYNGWLWYGHRQDKEAGRAFEAIRVAARTGAVTPTLGAARALQSQQPDSALATRGALIAAAICHAQGKDGDAQGELEWVVQHSREPALVDLARLRLAGLLADQKKFEPALRLLDDNHTPDFAALTLDLRGDILLALNRLPEARAAYRSAMEKAQPMGALHQLAQNKWEALGGGR